MSSLRSRIDLAGATLNHPVQRVLVHATTSLTSVAEVRERHPAFDTYDQRALLMARRDDLVCVGGKVDPDYADYLAGLGIGLDPTGIVEVGPHESVRRLGLARGLIEDAPSLDSIAQRVAADVPVLLDPFIAGPAELQLAQRLKAYPLPEVTLLGEPAAVARVNRKDLQRLWAQEAGVPVAAGEVVTIDPAADHGLEPLRAAVARRLDLGHPALVRGCDGASGSATQIVADAPGAAAALAWAGRRSERTYLVDRLHAITVTPNILLFVAPDSDRPVQFVAATDQILNSRLSHKGNRFPSLAVLIDEMIAYAEVLARRVGREGYQGWIGCDFCEYVDPATGEPSVFFAELNARINGACYPVAAAARLLDGDHGLPAFISGLVSTEARSFAELAVRLGDGLLRADGLPGSLVYNTGCLAHGYCAATVFDTNLGRVERRWDELARCVGVE